MWSSKMFSNKFYVPKEVQKILGIKNGDYIEYEIVKVHSIPHIYIKKKEEKTIVRIVP